MASYQRVALYILFDALERDLVQQIRSLSVEGGLLVPEEREKAIRRLERREDCGYDLSSDLDLLYGLDLGEKFQVLLRHKVSFDEASRAYYLALKQSIDRSIPIRNHIMHGRQLTVNEHVFALDFAQSLLRNKSFWPALHKSYIQYTDDPTAFVATSVRFLDDPTYGDVLNNLPVPDYDDTGFLPRPELERELKKKLAGRHPVITVLGEGGNGKTALALRVLYGLVQSHDHEFDAIIWVTAKTAELTVAGVREIENVATGALDIISQAAAVENGGSTPLERLTNLLAENKVLLVIDNYETVVGDDIARLAEDVPGKSKILFTSRLPIGGDLTVLVNELSPADGLIYFRRLVQAYGVARLTSLDAAQIDRLLARLNYKPLLIKWLVLGVQSGLDADTISMSPDTAMRFCLDNVILTLAPEAQAVIFVLATLPVATTPSVIEHISPLTGVNVNDGLAQLSRFGLVDVEISDTGEKLYRVKSFSRSFIHRLIKPKPEVSDRLMERYRQLDVDFNLSRNQARHNPYSSKNIRTDSRSRMVIAKKLMEAGRFAAEGELELAEQIIIEAKVLDPTFFETHRVEAFVAQQQNDFSRALAAFETAITLAPDEPQLYFFAGALLLRLSDNDRAATYLAQAHDRDPEAAIIHREIARNEMIRGNYDVAQQFVSRCLSVKLVSPRDKTISADLQIQLYIRQAEHYLRGGDYEASSLILRELLNFLISINLKIVDGLMETHLFKVNSTMRAIDRQEFGNLNVAALRDFLVQHFSNFDPGTEIGQAQPTAAGIYIGTMQEAGRNPNFGFLDGSRGMVTFVHRRTVDPNIWSWMLAGRAVSFDVEPFDGRERACNVAMIADGPEMLAGE